MNDTAAQSVSAPAPATPVLNIAAYRFVAIDERELLRDELMEMCERFAIKGTILVAHEGINLFLAGTPDAIAAFRTRMEIDARFRGMEYKESWSEGQPFSRMRVKLKNEIIAFGRPEVSPATAPGATISAEELKRWLDEDRDFLLLDTRNDYEVRLGTFSRAKHLDLRTFRAFPEKARELLDAYRDKPVVGFCTGGIRCEKATPWLTHLGFKETYSLEGGILKYFEEVGGDHYDGDCFVFDDRVAVNPALEVSGVLQCFVCLNPVTPAEQQDPSYVPHVSCPHCAGNEPVAE